MADTEFPVLDRGFVRLIDHMGSDLSVVNAARVSFGKKKEVFDEGDAKLVRYLAEHEHTSPFRHTAMTFHVKAPIFVFRQWMKHRVASEFNEISGRYVEFPPDEFYLPERFRQQAKVNKQGSEGEIAPEHREAAAKAYLASCQGSVAQYKALRCTARSTGRSACRRWRTSSACAAMATPSGRSSSTPTRSGSWWSRSTPSG